ncbi:hypothetical protein DY000_02015846 [Brassica cretica]|uniref:Uncharacterized protein n=1 Tax=Brassica cretica TaxID=69181 RepID=A0ABQ7CXM2_BRACR|nr:hypothetical protein DY000_02015846 [Brassica cretica]
MSSFSNFQKNCDVEMSNAAGASSSGPHVSGAIPAHIPKFLSFQSELARHEAEETVNPTRGVYPKLAAPVDDMTPEVPPVRDDVPTGEVVVADASVPEVEFQPSGSSTTPVHVVDAEPIHESMPPPPANIVIVLGLPAPSVIPAAMPKSRKRPSANPDVAKKRRYTKDSEAAPLPAKASGSGLASRHRAKLYFVSLIDEMISECGSEFERLAKELAESRERSSQLEGKLKVIEKGDFDLILAGLKSECILTPCLGELGDQVPIAEDSGDGAVPSPEGVIGEGEAPRMIEFAVSEDYELSSRNLTLGELLYPRSVSRIFRKMLETSVLGLGKDLGLITTLSGVITTSTYVSRIVSDLIPSRFKVRDMFLAYVTCMVGIEHLSGDNFQVSRKC